MCGIFGLAVRKGFASDKDEFNTAVRRLFLLSESRGKEAAGIALATDKSIVSHKDSVAASSMLRTPEYRAALDAGVAPYFEGGAPSLAAIGHARLVTNGLQGIDANNQPVWRDDIIIVHNGIVVNVDELWQSNPDIEPRAEVDTEVIAALIHEAVAGGAPVGAALSEAFGNIYGETSIAFFTRGGAEMWIGTNTGSIHYVVNRDRDGFFFASESQICDELTSGSAALVGFEGGTVRQLKPGHGMSLVLDSLEIREFTFEEELKTPQISPMLATQRAIEDKSFRNKLARIEMRRCTKCLLPQTMPFIEFSTDGVCNFCTDYTPWIKRPESDLQERLDRVRSKDGSPDCIVAFSGGRDSSYGLHVLKEHYGMTPLTFSYDWGMVTDLARRNQARICGKLGIEHIWISADIKQKRAHIRRNVLAWLRKPNLGLIPLFMAGDKEVLWHANKLMESYDIADMVFCTNDLEKTVFKQGFLGIDARQTTIHKPSTLPIAGKLGMAFRYAGQFLRNPAYFNRSMPDTLFAFFSYYVLKQNYFSLFDYMPWDENQINETLIGVYDWEIAPDTTSTWRIGDGTAPFYNFIYDTVAGFTEYDTFRSNQIREGMIDRETALALVEKENMPRWKSIREYTQMINIDFDETIRIIDRIPKLYVTD